jgi:competence protein ComEA
MRRVLWIVTALVVLLTPAWSAAQESSAQGGTPRPSAQTLNLNSATVQQLESLPGIGPRTAQRIVDYREKNGPFKRVEDLMNVQGIGEKSFLRLKPLVTVGSPKTEKPTGSDR